MHNNKMLIFKLLILGSILSIFGCSAKTGCSEDSTQCFGSSNTIFKPNNTTPALHPNFNYMRLTMNGQVAWLAQGETDQWPSPNTQVFYSADRSVFKWSNGRLTSVVTSDYNWGEHILNPINWTSSNPIQFTRKIDTVNGITGITEKRELIRESMPENDNFVGDKNQLIWMHEYTVSRPETMRLTPTYDSWYAFEPNNMNEPVYGQQCISTKYCLSWQVWKKS